WTSASRSAVAWVVMPSPPRHGPAMPTLGWECWEPRSGGPVEKQADRRRRPRVGQGSPIRHTGPNAEPRRVKLVVVEFMTLDGVMEAPGSEEHRSGRNMWALIEDDRFERFNGGQIAAADALLFGRTTYNIWAAFWPTAPEVVGELSARIS